MTRFLPRRVRALSIPILLALVSILSAFASPARSAYQDSVPAPSEPENPQGDEGGDADEVLIRTNPSRPAPDSIQDQDLEAAREAVLSWWRQVLRLLGYR